MTQHGGTTVGPHETCHAQDTVAVTLRVPAEFGCRSAQVAGDFTAWAPVVDGR